MTRQYFVGDFDDNGPFVSIMNEHGSFRLLLKPSLKLAKHSFEFAWGHGGKELSQLALAMLLYASIGDKMLALQHHEEFKWRFLWDLPGDQGWKLSFDTVSDFIAEKMFGG